MASYVNMTTESDVIDLTNSFTLIDHCQLANIVIELDDSLHNSPAASNKVMKSVDTVRPAQIKSHKSASSAPTTSNRNEKRGFGDCPICWDKLSENPLASTKCGHVFCLPCIQQVVLQTKRCPTCSLESVSENTPEIVLPNDINFDLIYFV